jgi:methylase of polypeptide subunit release factors
MPRRTTTRDRDILKRFEERYSERKGTGVAARIEREVIGVAVGLNGYTTPAQANELIRRLRLRPGMRVLDMGAGAGWPGLHIAAEAQCRIVMADIPAPALHSAVRRASRDGLRTLSDAVLASGAALPFSKASFDAIVHTDVMC